MSPFDITKSVTNTKQDLSTSEDFDKSYSPFMVNRILSNSPTTALFADAMNQSSNIPPAVQYQFYLKGIPKSNGFTKYIKKEDLPTDVPDECLQYICSKYSLNITRGYEMCRLVGVSNVMSEIDSRGGHK